MFRPRGEGYWTEILLGIVKHERRASFRPPRGYGLTAFSSLTLTIITYLRSIRRIKIFVLNEPLAAQAHRLDEAAQGVSKTCLRASGYEAIGHAPWVCLKLQF